MVLPIGVAFTAAAAGFGLIAAANDRFQEALTDEERKKIELTLRKLGLTMDQIRNLDTETEVAEAIKDRLSRLEGVKRAEILEDLRKNLSKDDLFRS